MGYLYLDATLRVGRGETLRAMTAVRVKVDASETVKASRASFRLIVALAVALRLGLVFYVFATYPHGWLFHSQGELGTLAQSLLAGHGLSSPFGGSTGPTAFLAPGYPALIALIFAVFGVFSTASALAVMLMQTGFCGLTIYLIMKVA